MQLKHFNKIILFGAVVAIAFSMCKTSDLRTSDIKKQGITAENSARGRAILQESLDSMHLEIWAKYPTYEATCTDRWERQMGLQLSPWRGENGAKLRIRCALNTFDSQVEWLEGQMKGEKLGIQSWQLYRQMPGSPAEKLAADKDLNFILPTMQYFMELPSRLSHAPIVAFAGEKAEKGQVFDLIFVTWESPEPNRNDQYLLYINRKTKRVERVTYTIRDNFMTTPKSFYGTALYSDFRQVEGVWLPFKMDVFPFGWTSKMKVHTFEIQDFRFGAFPLDSLYPFQDLPRVGDSKG